MNDYLQVFLLAIGILGVVGLAMGLTHVLPIFGVTDDVAMFIGMMFAGTGGPLLVELWARKFDSR